MVSKADAECVPRSPIQVLYVRSSVEGEKNVRRMKIYFPINLTKAHRPISRHTHLAAFVESSSAPAPV